MKKVIYSLIAIAMTLASCSDFTDIPQKGKNLLASTDDLDLLLNKEFDMWNTDMRNISGVIYNYSSVEAILAQPNKTRVAIMYGYSDDESSLVRYEQLTTSDSYYTDLYGNIGKVANPILQQIDAASGPEAKKKALKAEALTLRAYDHFLLVQKYAKAYNAATAANDPAIAYMTEDVNIQEPQPKKTVQEVYDLCLADINEAIALNAMPETAATNLRFNKAATYGVKAYICLGMQKYSEAVEAAKQALAVNSALYDYYGNIETMYSYVGFPYQCSTPTCLENPEVYFGMPNMVYYSWVNPNLQALMEPTYATISLFPTMSDEYKGIGQVMPAYAAYEDYGSTIGLSGWTGGSDFDHYANDSGLQTANMYLIIAEALIKSGDINGAMENLDILRKSRIDPTVYAPLKGTVTTKADAIKAFKADYLAENVWTWWNFIGMKRWNVDADWQMTLSQTIGGKTYTLKPESQLWVFPFPSNVTEKNPYMTWNKVK